MTFRSAARRAARLVPVAALLLLGACADLVNMPLLQSSAVAGRDARWQEIPVDRLLVDFGPVLRPLVLEASERRGPSSIEQRVVFANDTLTAGENSLDIRIYAGTEPRSARFTDQTLPDRLKEAFPDLAPASIPQEAANAYGLYTYVPATAVGGPTCVLAWQRLTGQGVPLGYESATAVLRFCRPDGSVDALLALMDGWRWSFGIGAMTVGGDRRTLDSILDAL